MSEYMYIGYDFENKNEAAEKFLDFILSNDLADINTYFIKRKKHRTYYKKEKRSQIDYFMWKRMNTRVIYCNVIPGESVKTQCRLIIIQLWYSVKRACEEIRGFDGENVFGAKKLILKEDERKCGVECGRKYKRGVE